MILAADRREGIGWERAWAIALDELERERESSTPYDDVTEVLEALRETEHEWREAFEHPEGLAPAWCRPRPPDLGADGIVRASVLG